MSKKELEPCGCESIPCPHCFPDSQDELSCCGGGIFYGYEPFCDCGHVAFEKDRASKDEAIQLVILCAQDIVDGWPTLTFRTIGQMTKKVDTLKQALQAVKK